MKLLGISGSLRQASFNTRLLQVAGQCISDCSFRLANIQLPLFNEDLEMEGIVSVEVHKLFQDIIWSDAVLIATPEYNKNVSGVLKNALDWISRSADKPLHNKPVAICSVAAGRCGGIQAQYSLRHCLTPFNPRILQGPEIAISLADTSSNELTILETERNKKRLKKLMTVLFDFSRVNDFEQEF